MNIAIVKKGELKNVIYFSCAYTLACFKVCLVYPFIVHFDGLAK